MPYASFQFESKEPARELDRHKVRNNSDSRRRLTAPIQNGGTQVFTLLTSFSLTCSTIHCGFHLPPARYHWATVKAARRITNVMSFGSPGTNIPWSIPLRTIFANICS